MMPNQDIKVKCKVCGRSASAAEFVLDPVFKTMACPMCVRDRKAKDFSRQNQPHGQATPQTSQSAPAQKIQPAASHMDSEDAELERAYQKKQEMIRQVKAASQFEKIDDDKIKMKCLKCGYGFVFNIAKRTPGNCPYCGEKIKNAPN